METGLSLYQPGAEPGATPIQELHIHGPSINQGDQQVIAWRVFKPRTLRVSVLQVDIHFQDVLVGRVDCYQWAFGFLGGDDWWRWNVSGPELAAIEERRHGSDLNLTLKCYGIISVSERGGAPTDWVPVHGLAVLQIPRSEWEDALIQLGYEPARYLTLPVASNHWPDWGAAVQEMEAAVRALSRGETHAALQQCLRVFEKVESAPYRVDSWKGVFDVESQKERALSELLSGIGTYLNLVGHHHSKTERDTDGSLRQSTVDQFEAEILVSMTQLMLAYLRRLPRLSTA